MKHPFNISMVTGQGDAMVLRRLCSTKLLSFVFVVLAGCSTAADDDALAITKVVVDAQKAGFEQCDLKGYLAQWTDDARITSGRDPMAGEYDVTFDRKQIEATRRILFAMQRPGNLEMTNTDPEIKIHGDQAELRMSLTVSFDGGHERVGEIYKLRRTADGWRVFENRYWMLETSSNGETTRFTPEKWAELDAAVAEARRGDNLFDVLQTLTAAHRWAECHTVAEELTDSDPSDVGNWLQRGFAAIHAAKADDALKSYRKAIALEPELNGLNCMTVAYRSRELT